MPQPQARFEARPPSRADIVVIGAGIVGLASAFFLARAGLDVVVLERRTRVADLTSARSGAGFRAQWEHRHNIDLMLESIQLLRGFAELAGLAGHDIGLAQPGYLYATQVGRTAEVLRERVARQQALGLPDVVWLSGTEIRGRWPHVSPDVVAGAYRAGDGYFDEGRLVDGLLRALGSVVVVDCTAMGLDVVGGRVCGLETSRGSIATTMAVLAAGPFANAWAADNGLELPLVLSRGQLLHIRASGLPASAPATIDCDNASFWRLDPLRGGARITATNEPEPMAAPLDDVPVDADYAMRALLAAARLAPFWGEVARRARAEDMRLVAGQYPASPDGSPIIGAAAHPAGLWLNIGYGGHGLMGALAGARRLARCVTQGEERDHPFACARFAQGRSHPPETLARNLVRPQPASPTGAMRHA